MPRHTLPSKPPFIIRELNCEDACPSMYRLVRQLNKDIGRKRFEALLAGMLASGYRCIGAYDGRKLVALMGFWVGWRFWCGKYIDIDNVVVDETLRGSGIGKAMLAWVEQEGRRLGCDIAVLDSYTSSRAAHRFYFREGYGITGYHFTKDL